MDVLLSASPSPQNVQRLSRDCLRIYPAYRHIIWSPTALILSCLAQLASPLNQDFPPCFCTANPYRKNRRRQHIYSGCGQQLIYVYYRLCRDSALSTIYSTITVSLGFMIFATLPVCGWQPAINAQHNTTADTLSILRSLPA